MVKRTEWPVRHHLWDMTQWSRVIFTDKSSFEVRPMKRNMRVWRKAGERFDAACIVPTYKSGYELVNVWGAFCCYGKPPLVRIDGRFSNKEYIQIYDTVLWPWAISAFGNLQSFALLKDNCGPHRAKAVRKYMEELIITRMDWPAQSPDLNPIENVWGQMKSEFRMRRRHPKDKDECWLQIKALWDELPLSYFYKLIGSMADRITEVIAKNGGSTKY